MIQFIPFSHSSHRRDIELLYYRAFPKEEQRPFKNILNNQKEGQVEIFEICYENRFAGLAIVANQGDWALLEYFAIDETLRSHGVGAQTLDLLRHRYTHLLLEIEDPDVPSDNPKQRQKRQHFYCRNHFVLLPFKISYFGIQMRVLATNDSITFQDYFRLSQTLFNEDVSNEITLVL